MLSNNNRITKLVVLLGLFGLSFGIGGDIILKDLKMYVNCEEFIIKAMCYNPVPLGYLYMNPDQTGGGGYCSPKKTPFGEWKSACYDSDYFDGSADVPERWPPGPTDGWFQALWERDFPVLSSLGVNTLRLYNANPTTRQATVAQLGTNGIAYPLGKNHVPFMDMCAAHGFKVIFPLVGDFTLLMNTPEEQYKQLLRNQIDEVGNHSALIMWNFSNELDLGPNPQLVAILNKYIAYIKQYTYQKWQRIVPITAAVVDVPNSYDLLMATLDVDVFSSNAGYRGLDFQDLWTGDRTPGFSGFANLSREHDKPLFISEIGWHSEKNAITYAIPTWFNQIWKDLVLHIDMGCIGGAFFEYSDEPNKADVLQQTMGVVHFTAAVATDGTNSNQTDVFLTDVATEKEIIFNAVKSGTLDNIQFNMNGDIFSLIGRTKTTLSPTECVAAPPPATTGSQTTASQTSSTNTQPTSTGTQTQPSSTSSSTASGPSTGSTSSQQQTTESAGESSASGVVASLFLIANLIGIAFM